MFCLLVLDDCVFPGWMRPRFVWAVVKDTSFSKVLLGGIHKPPIQSCSSPVDEWRQDSLVLNF